MMLNSFLNWGSEKSENELVKCTLHFVENENKLEVSSTCIFHQIRNRQTCACTVKHPRSIKVSPSTLYLWGFSGESRGAWEQGYKTHRSSAVHCSPSMFSEEEIFFNQFHATLNHSITYHIAGNFRGRKLLQIGGKYDFHRENFHWLLTRAAPKDATSSNFAKKTSRLATKPRNSQKFSPSKVSHYIVRRDEWANLIFSCSSCCFLASSSFFLLSSSSFFRWTLSTRFWWRIWVCMCVCECVSMCVVCVHVCFVCTCMWIHAWHNS